MAKKGKRRGSVNSSGSQGSLLVKASQRVQSGLVFTGRYCRTEELDGRRAGVLLVRKVRVEDNRRLFI